MPACHLLPVFVTLVAGLGAQATANASSTIAGTVRWPDRRAAAGAAVTVRWRAHPELPGLVGLSLGSGGIAEVHATTDATGRWKVELEGNGPFEVGARSADGTAVSPRRFPVMGGGYHDHVLEPKFVVAGVVRNATGEPQAGLHVRFEPSPTTWTRLAVYGMPMLRGEATTDAAGGYAFDLGVDYLRNPLWEPFLSPALADPARGFLRSDLLRRTAACRALDLVVTEPPTVAGVVLDADGKPVAGAIVRERLAPWRQVTTDGDGRFSLATRSPQGLVATRDGLPPTLVGKPPKNAPDAPPVQVVLQAGHRVRVRLRDPDGAPLAACDVLWVTLLDAESLFEVATRTDGDGVTTFAGHGGTIAGFVRTHGLYQQFLRARADTELVRDVVVALRPVRGTVTSAAGTPLAAVRVVARAAAGLPPDSPECLWVTYTDHGGRYEFPTLPAGPLELFVDGGVHGLTSAQLPADADRRDLRMASDGVVEVEVVDGDGRPAADAWVTLVRTGGVRSGMAPAPSPTTTAVVGYSDAQGRVRFTGLPEGTWQVFANRVLGDTLSGGAADAATGRTDVRVQLREQRG